MTIFQKIFQGEVFFRTDTTTPLQIFCEIMPNFKVIGRSKIGTDDIL